MPAPRHVLSPAETKRRVLLCWPYDRESFLAPFRALDATGGFAFSHLYSIDPSWDDIDLTPFPKHYWNDFASAQQALDALDPDAIVFRGILSPRPLALNLVARARRIPTYILHHGLLFSEADAHRDTRAAARYRSGERIESPRQYYARVGSSTRDGFRFLVASTGWRDGAVVPQAIALSAFMRYGASSSQLEATSQFPARMPTAVLCHSLHNAEVARALVGDTVPRLLLGNPEYDDYFRTPIAVAPSPDADDGYYLFIDSIVHAPELLANYATVAQVISVYERVARFAAARGRRLVIKLHPSMPEADWLPRNLPNVSWVRTADLTALVDGAVGCFGYMSTLTITAAWRRPTCFLTYFGTDVLDKAAATGQVQVVPALDFDPEAFAFATPPPGGREDYERLFFWRADGRATDRLGLVLQAAIGSYPDEIDRHLPAHASSQ